MADNVYTADANNAKQSDKTIEHIIISDTV